MALRQLKKKNWSLSDSFGPETLQRATDDDKLALVQISQMLYAQMAAAASSDIHAVDRFVVMSFKDITVPELVQEPIAAQHKAALIPIRMYVVLLPDWL